MVVSRYILYVSPICVIRAKTNAENIENVLFHKLSFLTSFSSLFKIKTSLPNFKVLEQFLLKQKHSTKALAENNYRNYWWTLDEYSRPNRSKYQASWLKFSFSFNMDPCRWPQASKHNVSNIYTAPSAPQSTLLEMLVIFSKSCDKNLFLGFFEMPNFFVWIEVIFISK